MIRSYFGLDLNPFSNEKIKLILQQQEILDALRVHSQQGGLCLLLGEPGSGKSVIKESLCRHDPKRMITPVVNRTMHTFTSTLKILCEAFQIDTDGKNHTCEKRLIEEAHRINNLGKMLVPIIDDAHLLDIDSLRRSKLIFEDFPKNHNLVLISQPNLLTKLSLTINEDIKSRVTYSVLMPNLAPDDMEKFILNQLDEVALAHNTFTPEALDLIIRLSEGLKKSKKSLPGNTTGSSKRPNQNRRFKTSKPGAFTAPLETRIRP